MNFCLLEPSPNFTKLPRLLDANIIMQYLTQIFYR